MSVNEKFETNLACPHAPFNGLLHRGKLRWSRPFFNKLSSNVHPMLIFLPEHSLHASEGVQGGSLDHIDHDQPGQTVNPGLGETSSQRSTHGVAD